MPTQVQFRRGNTTQNNSFTGAIGEITINTSNTAIRVHDGITAGGVEAATLPQISNANNLTVGTLSSARLPTSGVVAATYGTGSLSPQIVVDSTGRITSAANVAISIASSAVTGLAASATTDTTNATNISAGTLSSARLPTSGVVAATYGNGSGIAPQIVVDSTGRITSAANITVVAAVSNTAPIGVTTTSGTATVTHLNSGVTATTYGGSATVPIYTVNSSGHITSAANVAISIASSAVTGLAASATTDTTNATNISAGTLSSARLPTSGVVAATYGNSSTIPVITVDAYGRITSAANTTLTLGTMSTQNANAVSITGGNITGVTNVTATTFTGSGSGLTGIATTGKSIAMALVFGG